MSTSLDTLELHILRGHVRFHDLADQIHCATILFNAFPIERAIEDASSSLTVALACVPRDPHGSLDLAGYIRCTQSLQAANHHCNQIDTLLSAACPAREVSAIVHRAIEHATHSIIDAYRIILRNPTRPQPHRSGIPVLTVPAQPPASGPNLKLPTHSSLIKRIGKAVGAWARQIYSAPCQPRPLPVHSVPVPHSPSYQSISSDARERIQAPSHERR